MKTGTVLWVPKIVNVGGADPHDLVADWELPLAALPSIRERIGLHGSSPGKDPNLKFEVHFLLNVHYFSPVVKSQVRPL